MGRVNYSGLVIAGIGFFLTRFTVTLSLYQDPFRFYAAGVVPLVLGLGLAAFGVALTVAEIDPSVVRTTATWCLVGTGTMLFLVVVTVVGSTRGEMPPVATTLSRTYLSNFLIGGSLGGTLTGLYAARNRHHRRELALRANRLEVLNRLLRHEILNAVTVIRGYAGLPLQEDREAQSIIEARADGIASTVEDVRYLTETTAGGTAGDVTVDLREALEDSIERVRETHPDAAITADVPEEPLPVYANERLSEVFTQLLDNAVRYTTADEPTATVSVARTDGAVRVRIEDGGPGLPEREQSLLETGDIGEFDRPESGYGLNIVRLLVESYRGSIDVDVDRDGTAVTVELHRPTPGGLVIPPNLSGVAGVKPALPFLLVTLGAAIVAGGAYGLAAELLGRSVAGIGLLYGAENVVVGWITHEFHSIVFGFIFAGIVTKLPSRYRDRTWAYLAIGVGWAVMLWFLAAGVVAAVWLRLLGIQVPVPSLSGALLVTHLVWGVSLASLTALGVRYVSPRLPGATVR